MPLLAPLALLPALFAPHHGWHVGHDAVRACPGVSASRCLQATSWAATIRRRDCGLCLPHQTIAALPADGVALQVEVGLEQPPRTPAGGAWPPTIHARDVGGLEGVPRAIGVYQRFARYGRVEAYVFAFFGRPHPTAAQLAEANAELAAVRLRQ